MIASNMETAKPTKYEAKEARKIDTERQVCLIRFSPDGRFLFGGGYDSTIRRWDFADEEPKLQTPIEGHEGWVQDLSFSPNGKLLFSVDSWGQLCAWPIAEEISKPAWKLDDAHDGWIRSVAVSKDGTLVCTTGHDRFVRLWSTANGKLVKELPRQEFDVFKVVFQPDGNSLVTADLMGKLTEWNIEAANIAREMTFEKFHYYDRIQDVHGIHVLQFNEAGDTLICAGGEPTRTTNHLGIPTLKVIDWKSLDVKHTIQFGQDREGYIFDLVQHPDGYCVAVTSGTPGAGQLLIFRLDADEPDFKYTKMSNCHSVALHPAGKTVVVSATNRNSQGNGAVRDKEGTYLGNSSPLHEFELIGKATS